MGLETLKDSFQFEQTDPAATWTINHNLGTLVPYVECWIDFSGTYSKVIPSNITMVDENTVTVDFTVAQVGRAAVV